MSRETYSSLSGVDKIEYDHKMANLRSSIRMRRSGPQDWKDSNDRSRARLKPLWKTDVGLTPEDVYVHDVISEGFRPLIATIPTLTAFQQRDYILYEEVHFLSALRRALHPTDKYLPNSEEFLDSQELLTELRNMGGES